MHEQEIVGEAIAGRSAAVRKALRQLSKNVSGSLFDSAELLYETQENNYLSQWGYKNLGDFAEQELGMKARKAQYLTRVVKVYRAVGLSREVCEKIQISKLREIATLNPEGTYWNKDTKVSEPLDEHIVRLITEAEDMTLGQLRDEIAKLKGQDGPNRRIIRSYSTDLSSWENVIRPAMEIARRRLGSAGRDDSGNAKEYGDGVCIEMLAAEFLADPNNQEAMELPEEIAGLVAETELPKEITI